MPARYAKLGSVSSGTHRLSDLVRRFTDTLQTLDNSVAEAVMSEYPMFYGHMSTDNVVLPEDETEKIDYFSKRLFREECNHLVFFGDGRVTFGILSQSGLPAPSDGEDIWESEDASHLVNEALMGELQKFAPPYCYFGTSEGDGSDFGFWVSIEDLNVAEQEGRLCRVMAGWEWEVKAHGYHADEVSHDVIVKWNDRDEDKIPSGWQAVKNQIGHVVAIRKSFHDPELEFVAEVNDHGNTTLFNLQGQEIWSVT